MTPNEALESRILAAVSFLKDHGWTHQQAVGITANLQAESKVKHNQAQLEGGPAYGLAQWEGPRQALFKAWSGHDIHQSTFNEQLAFIDHELRTSEWKAGKALEGAKSAGDAASIFCRLYERPADPKQAAFRCRLAELIAKEHPDFSNVTA